MTTAGETATRGPLAGIRVVEFAGIGPGPHGAMILADLGAEVVRIERPGPPGLELGHGPDWLARGRTVVVADLKDAAERARVRELVAAADVLVEGNRPGVMERLGLGPDECRGFNRRLVYARMTGWGQEGPLAARAGHDINYLSITGGLHAIGRAGERPVPPLNLVADIAGGSMFLVTGVLAALIERARTGEGQVVDVAMVDGTGIVLQMMWALRAQGAWSDRREANLLDGSCPYYDTYACADGRFIAVGCLEPSFYAEFLQGLGLDPDDLPDRDDRAQWPTLRERFAAIIATRTRDAWTAAFEQTDACVTPVLDFAEAPSHPHLAARRSLPRWGGVVQAAPAPRFSAHTAPVVPAAPVTRDERRPLADALEPILTRWAV